MDIELPERYRHPLAEGDFRRVIRELRDLLDKLEDSGPAQLAKALEPRVVTDADGYSHSHAADGGSRGSAGSSVEAAVITRLVNPHRERAADMCGALLVARDASRDAVVAIGGWVRSVVLEKPCWKCGGQRELHEQRCRHCDAAPTAADDVPRCISHGRFELNAPARSGGRCRACNDWRADNLRRTNNLMDPPEEWLRALEAKRIERELRKAAA